MRGKGAKKEAKIAKLAKKSNKNRTGSTKQHKKTAKKIIRQKISGRRPPKIKQNMNSSAGAHAKSVSQIADEIRREQITAQRKPIVESLKGHDFSVKSRREQQSVGFTPANPRERKFIKTGIEGFDRLLEQGIPQGNSILLAGGAGSGKTIMCLQIIAHHASLGKKCLYVSFEEREEKLMQHMEDFGWPVQKLIGNGKIKITRMNPFDVTRNVDALLAKEKGELLIDVEPMIWPKNFSNPEIIVIDSLTSIGSAFTGKEDSYRIYIEQLFRFLEKSNATSFLITETEQIPKIYSKQGVEEFLADGVVVLYNLKHENVRENAIEVLKLRGAAHKKGLVAMQITSRGIVVYPEQEVFSESG